MLYQILHRPSSAPSGRLHSNHMKGKELKSRAKTPEKDRQKPLTDKEKEEREKVIDNLLERTKTLLGEKEVQSKAKFTMYASKRLDTTDYFYTIFYKGDPFCGSMFTFLHS